MHPCGPRERNDRVTFRIEPRNLPSWIKDNLNANRFVAGPPGVF
jgi:hypothetical protein